MTAGSAPAGQDALGVLARGSRTFSLAASLLPRDARADAAVVYAFCRHVDDLADAAPDPEAARADLDALREGLSGGGSGADPPVLTAFREVAARRGIDRAWPLALVAGCRDDLGPVRVADHDALVRYGYAVAGTVGLMCCAVLGAPPEARPFAIDLGVGMQITNICRDVAEDAANDRVYLPADRLRAASVDPEALVRGTADRRAVAAVVRGLLDEADGWYASARRGVRYLPLRVRPGILVAADLYRAIGSVLRARSGDALAGRAVVRRRALVVLRALVGALNPAVLGWGPAPVHDHARHGPLARQRSRPV